MSRPKVLDGMPLLRARLGLVEGKASLPDYPVVLVLAAASAAIWAAVSGG